MQQILTYIFIALYSVTILGVVLVIITENRNPLKTLPWIIVLVFAPGYTSSNVRNAALTADGTPQGETPLEEGKLMSAEEVALKLAKALRRRRSEVILTALGKVTVLAHRLFPRLTDRLTYSYIAREAGSPFK